jgi:hypothetical protein
MRRQNIDRPHQPDQQNNEDDQNGENEVRPLIRAVPNSKSRSHMMLQRRNLGSGLNLAQNP